TAIPASWAAPGPFSTVGFPSTVSWPSSGWYTPARIFTSVDLPAPFSPTSACASPPYRSIDPSTIACTAPNDFIAPRSDSSGAPSSPAEEPGEDCAAESRVEGWVVGVSPAEGWAGEFPAADCGAESLADGCAGEAEDCAAAGSSGDGTAGRPVSRP